MIGFDYSIKPTIMIVGDIEFPNLIKESEILGLGYISIPYRFNDPRELAIALIFKDEIKGQKVMERFSEWIKQSNNDISAFCFDIIEKDDNSYVICFHQNEKLLIERNVPFELIPWINPIITKLTYFKNIHNRSELYYRFKKASSFKKCNIYGSDKTGTILNIENRVVLGNINFYNEKEINENSHLYGYNPNNVVSINKEEIQINHMNRIKNIKYFFPVLYNEIIKRKYVGELFEELLNDFEEDVIIQAICNLVLEYRMTQEGINIKSIQDVNILEYLVNNYETPNSKFIDFNQCTKEDILEQIARDKEYYKKNIGGE